jgi:hypothetical protein
MALEKKSKRKIYFSRSTGKMQNGDTIEVKTESSWNPGKAKVAAKKS